MDIHPQEFLELDELVCPVCSHLTLLKNGTERTIHLQFVLTESDGKISSEEAVETFHQKDEIKQLSCSSQRQKELHVEQHEGVQQE